LLKISRGIAAVAFTSDKYGHLTVVKKSQNCAEIPKIVFGATMQFWLKTNYIMIQNKEYKTIFLNFKHFVP